MDKLGLNLGYFLFQVFNFIILVILLYAWAYKPIMNMLEERRKKVAQGLEDARIAGEARENAEKDAQKIVGEAQTKAAQIVREATERAEVAAREIHEQAQTDANKQREIALGEIQQDRERILGDLRGQVGALALAVSQKLIGETLDERRQHALIDEFFSGIKSGRVTVLENANIRGGAAEVTSALPLTDSEKDTVRREILEKTGSQAAINFRVDPSILGGLVIRVGDKVMDASVSGQLEGLRESMA
jgi:F-type H+-transporting ATPase subunit b